jgi:hypothetical protein
MAKITALPGGDVIYNVSHSVGRHGRNLETDVMLVKWLLNDLNIYLMPPTTHEAISSDPVPDMLGWTGVCTPETNAAILWFQKSQLGARDATINSAENWQYGPPGHHQFYTIWRLNLELAVRRILPDQFDLASWGAPSKLVSELAKYDKKVKINA